MLSMPEIMSLSSAASSYLRICLHYHHNVVVDDIFLTLVYV